MFSEWNRLDGLDPSALVDLATSAGCSPDQAQTAAAISMAESRGNPGAQCLNCVPGVRENSQGLWQINIRGNPRFASQNLYDPNVNAAAMYQISNGCTDWSAWTTFTKGTYQKFLSMIPGASTDSTSEDGQAAAGFDLTSIFSDPTTLLLLGLGLFFLLRR